MRFAARRGAGVSSPGDYGCVPLPITRETWRRLCPLALTPGCSLFPIVPPARRVSRPHTSSKLATASGALRVDERCAGVLQRDGSSNTSQYAVLHMEWQTGIHASNRRIGCGQEGGWSGGGSRQWKFRVLYTTRYSTHYRMLGRFRRDQGTVLADLVLSSTTIRCIRLHGISIQLCICTCMYI